MTLRLHEVGLEDVRRFSGRWRVGPFAPGLNLLAAPNETGKSTLLEAIRCAILLPHRAQSEEARRLRPLEGGIPTVTLALADTSGVWRIRKRFAGQQGRAELVAPDGRSWAGDEAEEEIRRLFGLPQATGRGPAPRGVWGALWVEQGASLVQPTLDHVAQDTLRAVLDALDAEIDTVTGARGAARLRAAIARELLAFQTPGGRNSAGRLREVEDRLAELAEEERDLRERLCRADEALARLADLRARRAARLAARPEQAAEEALAKARQRAEALRQAAHRRESLLRAAADATRLHEAAVEAWARRERDIAQAEAAARRAEGLAAVARAAECEAEAAANRRLAVEAAWAGIEAAEAERQARAIADVALRLREAEEAERTARRRGAASGSGAIAAVAGLAALGVAGLAVIGLIPPEAGWVSAAAALLAVATLGLFALRRVRATKEARREQAAANAMALQLAPDQAPEAALAAATARAQEARQIAAALAQEAAARGVTIPREVSAVERDQARAEAEEAEREAFRTRAEADEAEKAAREAAKVLADERARASDEVLRERLRQAGETLLHAARERDTSPAPTAEEIAAAEAEIGRVEAERKRIADEDLRLAEELREAETTVRQLEAEGIDDRLAALAEERERLERERQALHRERDGLRLLDRVLAEEEERAKAEWVAPVTRAVMPWLATVLGAESVEINQSLGITTIRRGGRAERVDILSAGTQEQIAVLVRLAFADLLERQGKAAPVILDDALVFSDDERMARMFEVLTEAAKTLQIILLTCRRDLFGRLSAHPLGFERLA